MQAIDHLMLRKGLADNVVVFPRNEYDRSSFSLSDGKYVFEHKAFGADMFRYSWNFGKNWTTWAEWEDKTTIDQGVFQNADNWWSGAHIVVQCKVVSF